MTCIQFYIFRECGSPFPLFLAESFDVPARLAGGARARNFFAVATSGRSGSASFQILRNSR